MDVAKVVGEGDVSVSLAKLKVLDEGTYICTVSTGLFQAQQIIQLNIIRKFHSYPSIQKNPPERLSALPLLLFLLRATPSFTLRGETGFEDTPDTELPLRSILSTGCSGL